MFTGLLRAARRTSPTWQENFVPDMMDEHELFSPRLLWKKEQGSSLNKDFRRDDSYRK